MIELNPNNADARVWLGHLLQGAGRASEARREFEAALRIAPGHVGAREALRADH